MSLDTRTTAILATLSAVASAGFVYVVTHRLAQVSSDQRRARPSPGPKTLARALAEPGASGKTDGIRPAGPEAMRDPPPDWDAVDEADDESFPASDPPGTY